MAVSLPPILCNPTSECVDAAPSPIYVTDNCHQTRIEALAKDYLCGKALSIHTASLRGTLRAYARHFEPTRITHGDRKGKVQARNVDETAVVDRGDGLERSLTVHKGRHRRKRHQGEFPDIQQLRLRHYRKTDPRDGFGATGHEAMQRSKVHGASRSKYHPLARSETIQSSDRNRITRRLSTPYVNRTLTHARHFQPIRGQTAFVSTASHFRDRDGNFAISDQLVPTRPADPMPCKPALRPGATQLCNRVYSTYQQVAPSVICSCESSTHRTRHSAVDHASPTLVFQRAGTCDIRLQACCNVEMRLGSSRDTFYRTPAIRCPPTASRPISCAWDRLGFKNLGEPKHTIRNRDLSDSECELEGVVSQDVGIETIAGTLCTASRGFNDRTLTNHTAWDQYNATGQLMSSNLAIEKSHTRASVASGHSSEHWPSNAQLETSSMEAALRTADAFLGTWNEE